MGVRVSSLFPPRTFPFEYEDQTVQITYTRANYSVDFIEEVDKLDAIPSYARLLSGTLTDWDLLDDKDKKWGTDEASLRKLPVDFLRELAQAIADDVIGGKDSSNGSVPSTTSTEAAPTGTPATADAGT